MRIPTEAIIADEKLTSYLLTHRDWNDKSGLLRRIGFTSDNFQALREAIRGLADQADAFEDGVNEYGTFYRVEGELKGPLASLQVVLIWMRRASDNRIYFVTLKPRK